MPNYSPYTSKTEVQNFPAKQAVSSIDTLPAIKQNAQAFVVTQAAIANGANVLQAVQDNGANQDYTVIQLFAEFNQPVTIDVLIGPSATNLTNRAVYSISVPANTKHVQELLIVGRYHQIRVTNTGTAPTTTHQCYGVRKSI